MLTNCRENLVCVRLLIVYTVYPKKYAHGFVVLCFAVVMQSFIMNSHEVFIHIHQGCFAGTGAIVRLPQCQWSKPDGYGKISQCITTTKHSKAKTVCIFLGIYCITLHRHTRGPAFDWCQVHLIFFNSSRIKLMGQLYTVPNAKNCIWISCVTIVPIYRAEKKNIITFCKLILDVFIS